MHENKAMTPDVTRQPAVAHPTVRSRTSAASTLFVCVGAASGVAGQLLFSNDWCLYSVPAALLAAMLTWLVLGMAGIGSRPGIARYMGGFALAIAIGLGSGAVFRVIPGWAFQEALGIDKPPGIRDLRIWRHYEGGPGEHSLIMEFHADDETIRGLTLRFPPKPDQRSSFFNDDQYEKAWLESRSWPAAYELFGGVFHPNGKRTWQRLTPIRDPEVFFKRQERGRTVLLLLDRPSGRVVILHSRG